MVEHTFIPSEAAEYARPGGPWDVGPLGGLVDAASGSSLAVVDGDRHLTFDELATNAARLGGLLADRGINLGEAVSFQLTNGYQALLAYLACWRLGAVAVPVHSRATATEVEEAVATVESVLHLHGSAHAPVEASANVDLDADPLPAAATAEPSSAVDPMQVAVVLFTAGSSGAPKAVLHTHRSLGSKARSMVGVHGLTADDVVLMPAPLAHVSGLLNGALVPWAAGMKTVLMAKWDTGRALDLIEQERVSFMVGPPTFFTGLLADPTFSAERVTSLRLVSCGGAGVTEAFSREAADRLGCVVKRAYGSTEAPTVATTPAALQHDAHAVTTEGCATPATRLRVVEPSSGNICPPRTEGELQVTGPELFAGYLDPVSTAATMDGDWFRTGDLARVDLDGWLTITGRLKDVIIRGGENIVPAEVATALEEHRRVETAIVIGVPDERLGEKVAAFVVATGHFDLDQARAWSEWQGLARYKWPEIVQQLDEIPLLSAGKPDIAALTRCIVDG